MTLSCPYGVYYCRIVLVLLGNLFQLSEEWVITKEVRHADDDSHGKGVSVSQIESFIRADRVVSVEPHRASAEHIGKMILGAFYVLHGVVVDLEVCLYIE